MKTKALSLNQLRSNCSKFVVEWRDAQGDERQQAQSFVADLFAAFGVDRRRAIAYEHRAKRASTGGLGYIDALKVGQCAIEMKSAGKDLVLAEEQVLDYLDSLSDAEMPTWVITSDFKNFRVTNLLDRGTVEFGLEELAQHVEDLQFLAGYQVRKFGDKTQELASIKAARIMADIYEQLEDSGYAEEDAGIFLVRLLFALYADDSGVWEQDLFYRFIEERTSGDGSDLGPQLAMLFQIMNKPEHTRQKNQDELLRRFPYVNGGIFEGSIEIAAFDQKMRSRLLDACAFNWSSISPAIFGSLFQAVKDPKARRELGEHYTTETNILKTINPLFMDDLRASLERNYHSVPGLKRLRNDLSNMRFLDPACGCGNFLVVAYREMRIFDLDILVRLQELDDVTQIPTLFFTKENLPVTLDHFAGIEIESWPARIAATALHLVDHQANQAMELALGKAPHPLPLGKIKTIHIGNALQMDWQQIFPASPNVYVMGNPPFIGQSYRDAAQRADLRLVWGTQYDGYLDYVTGWFKKSVDYFKHVPAGQFAFVSTNSVVQGQPVQALFKPLFNDHWAISFAHQSFAWASEAPGMAHVHCVIIGFTRGKKHVKRLFTYPKVSTAPVEVPVHRTNAYLIDGPEIWVTKRSRPLADIPPTVYGSKPVDGGNLIVEEHEYENVMADPIAAKYVRVYVGARELIRALPRWCFWLTDLDPVDLECSTVLRERLNAVKTMRSASPKSSTRELAATPHLFGERRQPTTPYVCIPSVVSETRSYFTAAHMSTGVVTSNLAFTAEDPDGYLFGIISSSMFITWQRLVGGYLKSDLRFSNTVVWNNLPLPSVTQQVRSAVIAAGAGVLAARELHPKRSLAHHYNPLAMDLTLVQAHNKLDRIVDRAFGAKKPLTTNDERRAILVRRYQELTN